MTREDWDSLAMERFAIVWSDGLEEKLAKEFALTDTTHRFGPRPPKENAK